MFVCVSHATYNDNCTSNSISNNHQSNNGDVCCICLDPIQKCFVTTCNHSFCKSCIKEYIKTKCSYYFEDYFKKYTNLYTGICDVKNTNHELSCPMCRQDISYLYTKFNMTYNPSHMKIRLSSMIKIKSYTNPSNDLFDFLDYLEFC